VLRGVEKPEYYIVCIERESVEGHEKGFQSGPNIAEFFSAIRPYVPGIDEMKHYGVLFWNILVEITDAPAGQAAAAADEILRHLDELGTTAPRLLHGEGPACWPLVAHAGTLGLPTRIGLEDTIVGPDGSTVEGNAELVQLGDQAAISKSTVSAICGQRSIVIAGLKRL
jgi:hypothetical protein